MAFWFTFCLEKKKFLEIWVWDCYDYWDFLTNFMTCFLTPLFDAVQNSSYWHYLVWISNMDRKKSYSSQIQLFEHGSLQRANLKEVHIDSNWISNGNFQKMFECYFKNYFTPMLSFDVPSFSTYIAFSQRKDLNFGRRMQWSKWPIPGKVQSYTFQVK